jgi:hypothetical protein
MESVNLQNRQRRVQNTYNKILKIKYEKIMPITFACSIIASLIIVNYFNLLYVSGIGIIFAVPSLFINNFITDYVVSKYEKKYDKIIEIINNKIIDEKYK